MNDRDFLSVHSLSHLVAVERNVTTSENKFFSAEPETLSRLKEGQRYREVLSLFRHLTCQTKLIFSLLKTEGSA